MTDDDDKELARRSAATTELAGRLEDFAPRTDLTYRTFEGLTVSSRSIEQSLLTGSILRSCTFTTVGFQRCDLDGLRIEGCEFIDCDFENIDFRSCAVVRSTFKNCVFDGALITDCSFLDTTFRDSSLTAAISECLFTSSTLVACDLTRSSFLQSRFDASTIERMTLGDCTFLYNIMKGCHFRDVRINAESLGMVYGLTEDSVKGMGLVYLGKDQNLEVSQHVPELLRTYELRRWNLGVAIMRINFSLTSVPYALAEYLNLLRMGAPVKRDELNFFVRVLEDLEADNVLPLMTCLATVDVLTDLAGTPSGDHSDQTKRTELLRALAGRVMMTLTRLLEVFEEGRLPVERFDVDHDIQLTLVFREPPAISASRMLSDVGRASGLPIVHSSETVATRRGSFVEVVKTTLLAATAFQAFLYLLNGSVIQLTELRARLGVLARRRLPAPYQSSALQPQQRLPPGLVGPMGKLLGHASGLDWLQNTDLKGYAAGNLIEGKVEDESPTTKPRRRAPRPGRAKTSR